MTSGVYILNDCCQLESVQIALTGGDWLEAATTFTSSQRRHRCWHCCWFLLRAAGGRAIKVTLFLPNRGVLRLNILSLGDSIHEDEIPHRRAAPAAAITSLPHPLLTSLPPSPPPSPPLTPSPVAGSSLEDQQSLEESGRSR